MSYNGSGTYVPPAGQPVATGTVIQSATFNTLVTDIGNTFNNVLPRDGQAPMLGQLKITDGTSAIPGIGFNSEASSGMFRPASGQLALVASGVENLRINSAGRVLVGTTTDDGTNKLQVNGATKVTGAFNVTGATTVTGALTTSGVLTASASTVNGDSVTLGNIYSGSTSGYVGYNSNVVITYTGVGTKFGLALKPATSTGVTNAITFLSSASTPGSGVQMSSIEHLGSDAGCNLAGTWKYQGVPIANTNSSITGTATNVTGTVAIANGGTGQTTGVSACQALGAVQQGTGVGQGANIVKLGWSSTGGGLRCTVDATDQGFIPFVTANPSSGSNIIFNGPTSLQIGNSTDFATLGYSGSGAVTQLKMGSSAGSGGLAHKFDRATGNYTIGNGTAGSETTRVALDGTGQWQMLSGAYINGGAGLTLANSAFLQIGSTNGYNIAMDYQTIQGRNNGAAKELILNWYGQQVTVGGAAANNSSLYVNGWFNSTNGMISSTTSNLKIQLNDGATTRGFISAGASMCFGTINAANTMYTFTVDNSGNAAATGNVTAYSDERIKTNWRDIESGFVERWADIKHGVYDRIDTGETQVGLSAQSVQAMMPHAVIEQKDGKLSLNYGAAAAVASVQLAKEVVTLRDELAKMKSLVKDLLAKVGV